MIHTRTVDVITSESPAAPLDPETRPRPWGEVIGMTATGLALALLILLHVCGSDIDPVRERLGDYALGSYGWVFDSAVLALAAGAVSLLGPALLRWSSAPAAAMCYGCTCLGLVAFTAFPRDPLGAPASLFGEIHRYAAVVSLVALPVGALLTTARSASARGAERAVTLLASGCLGALLPLAVAHLAESPLQPFVGLVQRMVVAGEVVLLLLVGALMHRLPPATDEPE